MHRSPKEKCEGFIKRKKRFELVIGGSKRKNKRVVNMYLVSECWYIEIIILNQGSVRFEGTA